MTVAPEAHLQIFRSDAANAGIANGDTVKVSSVNGSIILKAQLSDTVQPGLLFVPSHFRDTHVNLLTKNVAGAEAVKIERA
jgi:predicted molibdopterin-dependent oxidoreductase YjgC